MSVPGLVVVPDFVTEEEERDLLRHIGPPSPVTGPLEKGRERILRYGPGVTATGYDSQKGGAATVEMPSWLAELAAKLVRSGLWVRPPNAITVNEYLPTQGIEFHTDRPAAGPVIASLGLAGDAVMGFRSSWRTGPVYEVPFPRRTLVQMAGVCRCEPWRHSIYPVEQVRFSIVFRWAKA